MRNSKIYKVAGLSLLGFCAVSIGVDRANIGPIATQVAGFCGAFAGALVAQAKRRSAPQTSTAKPEADVYANTEAHDTGPGSKE